MGESELKALHELRKKIGEEDVVVEGWWVGINNRG